jgi:hypothetical protein
MALSLNGCGTRYLGCRWQPDGTYITTKWITFFFLPLVPLNSVRVIEGGIGTNSPIGFALGSAKAIPVPLDLRLVAQVYVWEIVAALFLTIGVPMLNRLIDKIF